MERFTADLRAPAGLTCLVARRRRRRLALRSLTAGAAALAAGAAALALPWCQASTAPAQAVDAAYVVKYVSSALSAAEPGKIAQMTVTTSGPALPGQARRPPPRSGPTATSGARSPTRRPGIRSTTRASAPRPATPWSATRQRPGPASADWAAGAPFSGSQPSVKHGCGPALGAFPVLFRLGLPGTAPPPVRCPRPWPRRCAPRSPADPWPWPAGRRVDGTRRSS